MAGTATGQSSYSSTNGTTYYDLTKATGDSAEINDALFFQNKPDGSSGTGLIQAIVRVQDPGGGDGHENGYNTSFRPLSYEENTSPNFTTSIVLNSVPIVQIDGVNYYEFRLDINQLNSSSLLSLDEIKLYSSDVSAGQAQGTVGGAWFTANASLVYDMDAGGNHSVLLDAGLSSGSGSSDMFFYVPVSNFGGADPDVTYVTLYSEFGAADNLDGTDGLTALDDPANTALADNGSDTGDVASAIYGTYTANDGFEEWSVSKQTGGVISGFKFGDTNGDGLWNAGETGLAGWTIDYTITYVSGKGAHKQTVTLTGSVVTSDGTTDVNGDGIIDPAGFYSIFVPASTDKNETYTITLTEHGQTGFVNTYDGDATANSTTTFTFSGNDLNLTGSTNISGHFGVTEQMNFGNFETFSISGTKYTDANGDGATNGDVGLGGVTIFIDKDASGGLSAGDATTVTASDGTWSFAGLDASYAGLKVYEVLPSGSVQTLGNAGYTITGTSGTDQTGLNFANFEKFDISGTKYNDANGDGATDGDVGLGGVTIFIDKDGSGGLSAGDATTVTASDGTWSFTGLDASYAGLKVYEVLPSGDVQTLGAAGYTITGTSGSDQTALDFANFETFSISGTKYTDITGDGLTSDDTGLGGVTIFIDKDGSGGLSAGDATTVTASDGTWSFSGLDASYAGEQVYEVLPSGYVQTLGAAGYTITGTSGTDQTGLDFSNFETFSISGTKYTDANGDGATNGDVGLGGVTIFIDKDASGGLSAGDATTVTASDGTWSFAGLDASYAGLKVYEVLPSGSVQTLGNAGYTITGTSGTDQTGLDFANFLPNPDIAITKYVKTDVSGAFVDANDPSGPLASASTTVDFKVVVSNTGNEALSGISISDTVDHNGVETNEVIDYNLVNAQIDIDNDGTIDGAWSDYDQNLDGTLDDADGNFATVDDFVLAAGDSFSVYYSLDSALGQHENTAAVEAVSAISDTTVLAEDDANYYVVEDEDCVGVRTPGFWASTKWGTFWDAKGAGWGTAPNEPHQAGTPGFAGGELLYKVYLSDTNGDHVINSSDAFTKGLLIGDYNKNGITDAGEDTVFISLADAKTLINASSKQIADGKTADGIYMLGRDVVATWLNYLANNPGDDTGNCIGGVNSGDGTNSPKEYLDAAIDWFQQFASTTNGTAAQNLVNSYHDGDSQSTFQFDARIAPSSASWQNAVTQGQDLPVSAAAMHSALDGYNNTGTIAGVEYCCDADSELALNVLSQVHASLFL